MRFHIGTLALLTCLATVGCSEPAPPPEPPPVDQTVFKEQVQAIDRARSVESELEQRKRDVDRQVERDSDGEK